MDDGLDDLFEGALSVEDDFYEEGYKQGVEDGERAGRIEGRVFGLEKGFEKYLAMGQLHGKACVWTARMPEKKEPIWHGAAEYTATLDNPEKLEVTAESKADGSITTKPVTELPPLPQNSRLDKHIATLYALTEAESLSTLNNEDSVSDFDDRYKRALAKAKIIQNIIGERDVDLDAEDSLHAVRGNKSKGIKFTKAATAEKNIEDFGVKPAAP